METQNKVFPCKDGNGNIIRADIESYPCIFHIQNGKKHLNKIKAFFVMKEENDEIGQISYRIEHNDVHITLKIIHSVLPQPPLKFIRLETIKSQIENLVKNIQSRILAELHVYVNPNAQHILFDRQGRTTEIYRGKNNRNL